MSVKDKPKTVVSLGSETRILQFKEFIDFWLEMTQLVPMAARLHLACMEGAERQTIGGKVQ